MESPTHISVNNEFILHTLYQLTVATATWQMCTRCHCFMWWWKCEVPLMSSFVLVALLSPENNADIVSTSNALCSSVSMVFNSIVSSQTNDTHVCCTESVLFTTCYWLLLTNLFTCWKCLMFCLHTVVLFSVFGSNMNTTVENCFWFFNTPWNLLQNYLTYTTWEEWELCITS